jgi:tetratricopeptide (TPR) repeat protein
MWKSSLKIDKIYHDGYILNMKTGTLKLLALSFGAGILSLMLGGLAAGDELFDTKASDAHFQEGLKLYFKQQYEDANKEFEEAIKIDPDNAKAYYFIGYSYYKLRNMPKAMETFEQAYRLDKRYSPIPRASSPEQPESEHSPDSPPASEPQPPSN